MKDAISRWTEFSVSAANVTPDGVTVAMVIPRLNGASSVAGRTGMIIIESTGGG